MQQSRNSIDRLTSWWFWLYFAAWSFYFISFFNLSSQLRHDRSVQNVFLIKKDILESFSPSTRQWSLVVHRASKNAIFEQENDEQNSFLNFLKECRLIYTYPYTTGSIRMSCTLVLPTLCGEMLMVMRYHHPIGRWWSNIGSWVNPASRTKKRPLQPCTSRIF